MKQMEVVFCGNSIYLCGLAAGLQPIEQLRIRLVDNGLDKAMPELKMLCPDVVIFEAVNNTSEMIEVLCKEASCLMIITVYPETDSIEVFSGKRYFTSSVDNLVQVITEAMLTNECFKKNDYITSY